MPRNHVIPEVDEEQPKYKKRAKVTRTPTRTTKTVIETVPDDPTLPTMEGNRRMFLDQAMRRFQMAVDAEVYNRTQGLQDALMVDGEGQWDDDIRGKRLRKRRPCLTLNRFIPMIAHVANEQRMSRPAIQIDPVGGGADPDSAEIRQGLIRHIEIDSSAETVYDNAFERMIEKGWSWFRIVTDWESPKSRHQVIRVEGFTNDFCVYSDPTAEDPTRKDMKWGFVVYDMPRGEYIAQYPNSQAAGLMNFSSIGDNAPGWITTDSIRVAEYYYLDQQKATLVYLVGQNEGVWLDEIESRDGLWYNIQELAEMDEGRRPPEQVLPIPVETKDGELVTRESYKETPKWAKINAVEILDGDSDEPSKNTAGRKIAGKYIPLIMVCGRERWVKGVRRLSGMVRNNREAQRMYNYLASGFVEAVALAPKAPYVAAAGQVEKYKKIWDTLNEENWPYLMYDPITINQQNVPPPQRQSVEPPVVALLQGLNQFDNILKIGFNIFDASLGSAKSDQSGKAIAGLQARSDSANYNWIDNSRRSMVYAGQVILEMIPDIYDAPRIITIDRADKKEQITINQEFAGPDGKKKSYDMTTGKYSCTVSLGQYASKREKAVQSLTDVAKNVPAVSLALLPLILENMDSPMAKEAAAIIKRMQPPNLQEPGSPEQIQANYQQLVQQHGVLVQALQKANEILKTKVLDQASKERIAGLMAQAQIVTAGIKTGNASSIAQATQEYQRISQALDQDHERVLAQHEASHEIALELIQQAQPAAPPGQPAAAPAQ